MSKNEQAAVTLVAALVVGVLAQSVARQQAAVLGLSVLDLALLGYCVGAVAKRQLGV